MVGLLVALPTPAKRKSSKSGTINALVKNKDFEAAGGKKGLTKKMLGQGRSKQDELPAVMLPTQVSYMDRSDPGSEELAMWDDPSSSVQVVKAMCHRDKIGPLMALPLANDEENEDDIDSG